MNFLFLCISMYLVIITSCADQISWIAYSVRKYSFVADDRIQGGLWFPSQNHHWHSLLLHFVIVHIKIVFNYQPYPQYSLLIDSIPFV
jgi:hypothetical protein